MDRRQTVTELPKKTRGIDPASALRELASNALLIPAIVAVWMIVGVVVLALKARKVVDRVSTRRKKPESTKRA